MWIIFKRTNLINTKGVYLAGRCGWSDYLNFIYADNLPKNAFDLALEYVTEKYGIHNFRFEQIKENTLFYGYLKSKKCFSKVESSSVCVTFDLPDTEEQYLKSLSKSARQNIRTAFNHGKTDGKSFEFRFDDHPDLSLCKQMRAVRVKKKQRPKNIREFLGCCKARLLDMFKILFPKYLPFETDKRSRFLSCYIDGELAAWFNVGVDVVHRQVVVMAVGTNEAYARYSPGILTMKAYIDKCIVDKKVTSIDFTRGNERYKYMLGGKEHLIHNVSFRL